MKDPITTEMAPGDLRPWGKNPRRNDGEPVERVKASIRRFGFAAPIVARMADRTIIAGHTRWKAAMALGLATVPVRLVDLSVEQAEALALADNRLTEATPWDEEGLRAVLADLDAQGVDLDGLGWSTEELDAIISEPVADPAPADDDVPEVAQGEPDSRAGEVYELGPHRLWCGSNTDPAIRAAACAGVGAVVTDPPYGIGYNANGAGGNGWTKRAPTSWDASRPAPEAFSWMLSVAGTVVLWGGNYFADLLPPTMGWLVWDKGQREFSLADCELAWTSLNKAARVITYSRAAALQDGKEHPTQKPVAVMVWTLEKTCEGVAIILDPFGGSGTTLLACASTGRVARVVELDPRYCDVIRRRWTRYARANGIDPGSGALEAT